MTREEWKATIEQFEEGARLDVLCDRLATMDSVNEGLQARLRAAEQRLMEIDAAIESVGSLLTSADAMVALAAAADRALP